MRNLRVEKLRSIPVGLQLTVKGGNFQNAMPAASPPSTQLQN